MYNSDDTQLAGKKQPIQTSPVINEEEKQDDGTWKKVVIGGVAGIVIGGGSVLAANAITSDDSSDDASADNSGHDLPKQAQVSDGQSFSQAFNEARAQVGPGGVFMWHGRLYNTYTEAEWNSMSDEDKHEFALAVAPQAHATESYAHHAPSGHAAAHHHDEDVAQVGPSVGHKDEDVSMASTASQGDDDVHVVGTTTVQGHTAVAYDVNGDGQADVAVIDVNDNHQVDAEDIIIDRQGNMATMGQVAQAQGHSQDDGLQATGNEDSGADDPNIQASYSGGDDSASVAMGGDDITGGYDPGDDGSMV